MKLTTQKSILSLLTATLFLASGCDHIEQPNEPDIVGYTETAQQAIENGLTVGANEGHIDMSFYYKENDLTAQLRDGHDWCHMNSYPRDKELQVHLDFENNPVYRSRTAELYIRAGNKEKVIVIRQQPFKGIKIEKQKVIIDGKGGKVYVKVVSDTKLKHQLTFGPSTDEWLSYIGKEQKTDEKDGFITTTYCFKASINTNFVRKAMLTIHTDTTESKTIDIYQENLSSEIHLKMRTNRGGELAEFLQQDRFIFLTTKALTIVGPINGDDISMLREMMGINGQLEKLNLEHCNIVHGGGPYKIGELKFHTKDNIISEYMFWGTITLTTLILPCNIESIEKNAFSSSMHLRKIDIPSTVKSIGDRAFEDCYLLTKVNIHKDSQLTSIGRSAFYLSDAIQSLFLPSTILNLDPLALNNTTIKDLYVGWTVPPTIRLTSTAKGCTLHVPKGSKEVYRNDKIWSRYANIVEYDIDDYEEEY